MRRIASIRVVPRERLRRRKLKGVRLGRRRMEAMLAKLLAGLGNGPEDQSGISADGLGQLP